MEFSCFVKFLQQNLRSPVMAFGITTLAQFAKKNIAHQNILQKKHCTSKILPKNIAQQNILQEKHCTSKHFTKKLCTSKHVQYLQNCTALSFLHNVDELDTATFECTLIFNLSLIFCTSLQYCFTVLQYVVGLQSRLEQRCVVSIT